MGPAPKTTPQAIKAALEKWLGDVTRSALELGVSRVVLYRHMRRHGIDPDEFRYGAAITGRGVFEVLTEETVDSVEPSSPGVTCARGDHIDRFRSIMSKVGTAVEDIGSGIKRRAAPPPRLRPDQETTLLRLRSQLQAKVGAELLDSSILQDLFDWAIQRYSERILSYEPQAEKASEA